MADLKGDIPTAMNILADAVTKIATDVAALKTAVNAHTHAANGAAANVATAPAMVSYPLTHSKNG